MLCTASARVSDSGSSARPRFVDMRKSGVNATNDNPSATGSGTRATRPSPPAATGASDSSTATIWQPPNSAGAMLSGCPSSSVPTSSSCASDSSPPSISFAIASPAARAEADAPRPRPSGISDSACTEISGARSATASNPAPNARRTFRCSPSPLPESSAFPETRASTRACSPNAIPAASNAAPRFAVEAGTRTRTISTTISSLPRPKVYEPPSISGSGAAVRG